MSGRTSKEVAALLRAIRVELRRLRDPEKAAPMRANMKSAMPFLGVQSTAMRAACRKLFPAHPLGSFDLLVDPIATQRLGLLARRYPRGMATRMRAWSRGRDIWKRRSAILFQFKLKDETDAALLFDCIRPSMEAKEFFLRKAFEPFGSDRPLAGCYR